MNPNKNQIEDASSKEDEDALKVIEAIEAEGSTVSLSKTIEGEPDFAAVPTIDEIQSETVEDETIAPQGFEAVRQRQLEASNDRDVEAEPGVADVLSAEPAPLTSVPIVRQKRSYKKPILISFLLFLLIGAGTIGYLKVRSHEPGEAQTKYTDLRSDDLPGGNGKTNTVNVQTTVQDNSKPQ